MIYEQTIQDQNLQYQFIKYLRNFETNGGYVENVFMNSLHVIDLLYFLE